MLVRNPLLFGNVINQEKVNKLVITSSALSLLNPTKHPTLEVIQLGGEAVPLKLALRYVFISTLNAVNKCLRHS